MTVEITDVEKDEDGKIRVTIKSPFVVGELIPLKGIIFKVASIDQNVMVLQFYQVKNPNRPKNKKERNRIRQILDKKKRAKCEKRS